MLLDVTFLSVCRQSALNVPSHFMDLTVFNLTYTTVGLKSLKQEDAGSSKSVQQIVKMPKSCISCIKQQNRSAVFGILLLEF